MRPVDLQAIGADLAIKWEGGHESYIPLQLLRSACPCASCKGETDIFGNLYKGPEKPLQPSAVILVRIGAVGGYGIQPVWADGHSSGIYSHDYLLRLAGNSQALPP
jgi:DUF971 family protein